MSKFGMWDPRKNDDYQFFDDTILEFIEVSGTCVFLHKYIGPKNNTGSTDPSMPDYDPIFGNTKENHIQDLLFLENRDRNYDESVYELYGMYNVHDTEFDIRQFGMFLEADTVYLEFHLNDTIKKIGRKMMSGDVLELPHLRDDALLDPDAPAINRYYVVQDVNYAASGYSPTWFPHIIRVKLKPMTDSQEFSDILDNPALDGNGDPIPDTTLSDILSDFQNQIIISDALVEAAEKEVDRRNFETQHFYVVPGDECNKQYPWIFAGDGIPPNGAELAGSGNSFPLNAPDGTWYLRTDYEPHVLFKKEGRSWRRKEVDYRKKWNIAHRILESYISNSNQTTIDGETFPEKQPLSKAVKPKADF